MSAYTECLKALELIKLNLPYCDGMSGSEQAEEALDRLDIALSQMFAFSDAELDEATKDRMVTTGE
jgi:hypothetical protein